GVRLPAAVPVRPALGRGGGRPGARLGVRGLGHGPVLVGRAAVPQSGEGSREGSCDVLRAVVMAGGEGTRLRPMTANQPKPLLAVANRPIMEHVLRLLKKHGFTHTP